MKDSCFFLNNLVHLDKEKRSVMRVYKVPHNLNYDPITNYDFLVFLN
jgi:hypothetical protein